MIYRFADGIELAGYLVVALFFFRFWHRTRYALLLWFSLAFLVLAIQPALTGLFELSVENQTHLYLIRFAGYALIAMGVVWANRKTRA